MQEYKGKDQQAGKYTAANAVTQRKKNGRARGFSLVDNRQETAQLRAKMQPMNSNQPRREVVQAKAFNEVRQLKAEEPVQKKENRTGLPDDLKAGVENFSGLAMDDVRVHYNSDKPAQLQAHAYTQGTDIHVAPGQEKHLPHETWHVVQQKEGRVRPTVQMKGGVAVNDDPGLEGEAEVMGARTIQTKSTNGQGISFPKQFIAQQPVQRVISEQRNVNDKYKGDFNSFLSNLNKAVQKAYFFVIHYPHLKSYADLDGHTEHWRECWNNYLSDNNPALLKAAFGYAVETLATMIYLPAAPGGLSVELQGIRGGTRPDVVLKNGNTDVGWLDITASQSAGHVWGKAGWESKQIHLGEVTYPSLDPQVIQDNVANKRDYDDQTDPKEVMHRVNYFKWIQNVRRSHWKAVGKAYFDTPLASNNKTHKRQYIRQRLADYLGLSYYDLPPQTLGSVLRVMNVDHSKHGYKEKNKITGTSRAKGESILQQHDRELPGVESYSPQILQNPSNQEKIEKITEEKFTGSGQQGFNPAFQYNPFLADESSRDVVSTSQGDMEIMGAVKRLSPLLNKTVSLNFFELKSLLGRMSSFTRKMAINSFGIKVRLEDGSIAAIKISDMEGSALKRIYLMQQQRMEKRKKDRQELLNQKRLEFHQKNTLANMTIPSSLSLPMTSHLQQVDIHGSEQLNTPLQFEILGFAFEMENGTVLTHEANNPLGKSKGSDSIDFHKLID